MTDQQQADRPNPEEDPFACSLCGCALGTAKRISGEEYCDACQREHGMKPPMRRCLGCGQHAPEELMDTIDVSSEDEYYPEIRYLCASCSGGEPA